MFQTVSVAVDFVVKQTLQQQSERHCGLSSVAACHFRPHPASVVPQVGAGYESYEQGNVNAWTEGQPLVWSIWSQLRFRSTYLSSLWSTNFIGNEAQRTAGRSPCPGLC